MQTYTSHIELTLCTLCKGTVILTLLTWSSKELAYFGQNNSIKLDNFGLSGLESPMVMP